MRVTRVRLAACFLLAALALAVETETWTTGSYEDFLRGQAKGLAIRGDGLLTLAPASHELLSPSDAFLWTTAVDTKGTVYTGGGGMSGEKARVYAVDPQGKSRTIAELDGLQVQALALDKRDRLYVATGPDGKIFRIEGGKTPEVFYEPKSKYIWQMVFDQHGNLFIATGDRGEVHRVEPNGKGKVFFETDEVHARSLAVGPDNTLYIGTEPGGLIVKVTPEGAGFVVYQADKREISALALDPQGRLYAAGVGIKQQKTRPPVIIPPPPPKPEAAKGAPSGGSNDNRNPPPAPAATVIRPSLAGGSEVYEIAADGYTRTIWKSDTEVVYALAVQSDGAVIAGTGNDGVVYRLGPDNLHTRLWQAPSSQITSFSIGPKGAIFASTGNVGKLYRLGPDLASEGTLESDVFDADGFSYWGRAYYRGEPNGGVISLQTRSGNLDRPRPQNWSDWSKPITGSEGGRIPSPGARFLQWKLTLKPGDGRPGPQVSEITVAHMGKNVAPQVTRIAPAPPNYQFPSSSLRANPSETITLAPLGQKPAPKPRPAPAAGAQSMRFEKGFSGVRWLAEDPNGDELLYTLYIRGDQEKSWRPLAEDLETNYYSWDSTAYPDGRYRIKVVASDAPSNPPDQKLQGELVSEPLLIDNSPPVISGLTARVQDGKLVAQWRAEDALSLLGKAEYSLDGGDWTVIEPESRLTDSAAHTYTLSVGGIQPGEHLLAVRVVDEFRNPAVAKALVER